MLAKELIAFQSEAIVSSLEPKARQTAEIIAEECRLTAQTVEGLHEHDRSHVPYLPKGEFQTLVKEFFSKPDSLVFGSETAMQALDRFETTVRSFMHASRANGVIFVSHGTVIGLFVASVTGCDGYQLWQKLELPSCVVLDLESKSIVEEITLR